ncbi:hypothetical protein [Novosphingobium aquae]|uniref:Uncharacterized protein n=1 Tax=Novosphingobium aquae TaxID=3133435 RepID=A0ABU8S8D5_9SPHN
MPRKSVATLIGKSVKGGSFAAMPYAEVPAFYDDLHGKAETVGSGPHAYVGDGLPQWRGA